MALLPRDGNAQRFIKADKAEALTSKSCLMKLSSDLLLGAECGHQLGVTGREDKHGLSDNEQTLGSLLLTPTRRLNTSPATDSPFHLASQGCHISVFGGMDEPTGSSEPALAASEQQEDGTVAVPSYTGGCCTPASARWPRDHLHSATDAMRLLEGLHASLHDLLCSRWTCTVGADEALAAIDFLAGHEEAVNALVKEARVDLDLELRARTDAYEARCNGCLPSASVLDATPPYWATADGARRLVRADFNLKSHEVGRLHPDARVYVLETRQTMDGAWRAAIALDGGSQPHGWMTIVSKDGTEHATYCFPQPLPSSSHLT